MNGKPLEILLVEDDPAHAEIVKRCFEDLRVANPIKHVSDGDEALDYLYHRGQFADPESSPEPGLVLLDLRMPRVGGLEVLETVKADPDLKHIPIVVLTTSAAESDMVRAYGNHANSYLVKPVDFPQFMEMMKTLDCYWLAWNQYPY